MNLRFVWVLKPVIVGLIVLVAVYYLFSLASSIMGSEQKMMDQLSRYNDTTFEYWSGYNDALWLGVVGMLIACFAGGMAATILSRVDVPFNYGWIMTSAIAVIFVVLAADANTYLSWSNTLQMAQAGTLGRPIDPSPFVVILFIIVVFDVLCFLASAAGGLIVELSTKRHR